LLKGEKKMSESQATPEILANAENHYEVTRADLPLHCPMDGMSLWNSHPKVYLPIEKTGKAKCPYCGADYTLKD
jgi:uncharacterized Zn-finger protein